MLQSANLEENGFLLRHQGGLLYKAPLTASVFKNFSSSYQQFSSTNSKISEQAFVYADSSGIKFVTSVVDESSRSIDGVFALSMAEDGIVEMLMLHQTS